MKNLFLFFFAISMLGFVPSEAKAQRLLGRIFGVRPAAKTAYIPSVQHRRTYSYSSSKASYRAPVPVTGYGSNLHRNYMIRRAQKQSAISGIPPRQTGNILWAR